MSTFLYAPNKFCNFFILCFSFNNLFLLLDVFVSVLSSDSLFSPGNKFRSTFLDKSTSRVIQMHQEDFIEKDDEVINLLNPELQKENINNNNINNNLNPNEEESES